MDIPDFLRAHPPFDRLGPADLAAAVDALVIAYAPRGTRVLRQGGERSRNLYLIRKGSVRLERDGRVEQVLESGDLFGFPSLIGRASPHADAVVAEDTLLYQWPEAVFERLMAIEAWKEFFLLDLVERLRRASTTDPLPLGRDLALPARRFAREGLVRVGAGATVGEAARRMRDAGTSAAIIDGDRDGDPPGILTDRDLRGRVLAEGLGPDTIVGLVASRPLRALPASASLYEALVFMLEHRVHHVPLVEDGAPAAMLTDTDLLRLAGRSPLGVMAAIEQSADVGKLDGYGRELRATVEGLAAGGVEAIQIARVVARLNDALAVRLLRQAEAAIGPPPVPYAWIVFGSEGRTEQLLPTDQDNAIVYAAGSPGVDDYFRGLAERVVSGLIAASFPPCPGGFMATRWCHPMDHWVARFHTLLEKNDGPALLDASTLFDYRPIHGTLELGPIDEVLASAPRHPIFLRHLARTALAFEPPLGLLGHIREGAGGVDLKKGGLLPVVGLARVYALEAGSPARSTLDRLAAATAAGCLSVDGARTLGEALRFLLGLRLAAQLRAASRAEPPSNFVRLDDLSPLQRRLLKDTFAAIRELQRATALRFLTERMG